MSYQEALIKRIENATYSKTEKTSNFTVTNPPPSITGYTANIVTSGISVTSKKVTFEYDVRMNYKDKNGNEHLASIYGSITTEEILGICDAVSALPTVEAIATPILSPAVDPTAIYFDISYDVNYKICEEKLLHVDIEEELPV